MFKSYSRFYHLTSFTPQGGAAWVTQHQHLIIRGRNFIFLKAQDYDRIITPRIYGYNISFINITAKLCCYAYDIVYVFYFVVCFSLNVHRTRLEVLVAWWLSSLCGALVGWDSEGKAKTQDRLNLLEWSWGFNNFISLIQHLPPFFSMKGWKISNMIFFITKTWLTRHVN